MASILQTNTVADFHARERQPLIQVAGLDSRKLVLGLKGLALFYALWAGIFFSMQPRLEAGSALVSAPAVSTSASVTPS